MFVIHYSDAKGSLVAIEGPVACKRVAETYLEMREHYLEFTPRILSLSALRAPTPLISDNRVPALPPPAAAAHTPCTCGYRQPAQPEFA